MTSTATSYEQWSVQVDLAVDRPGGRRGYAERAPYRTPGLPGRDRGRT